MNIQQYLPLSKIHDLIFLKNCTFLDVFFKKRNFILHNFKIKKKILCDFWFPTFLCTLLYLLHFTTFFQKNLDSTLTYTHSVDMYKLWEYRTGCMYIMWMWNGIFLLALMHYCWLNDSLRDLNLSKLALRSLFFGFPWLAGMTRGSKDTPESSLSHIPLFFLRSLENPNNYCLTALYSNYGPNHLPTWR